MSRLVGPPLAETVIETRVKSRDGESSNLPTVYFILNIILKKKYIKTNDVSE